MCECAFTIVAARSRHGPGASHMLPAASEATSPCIKLAANHGLIGRSTSIQFQQDACMQERYSRQIPFNFDSNKAPVATYDRLVLATPAFDGNVVHWDAVRPPHASEQDRAALWDLILFGDGGAFVDRIITPVFRALAYEISNKGSKGVEPAMRITYDDANESFVLPQNITRILKDIGACALTRHGASRPLGGLMHARYRGPQLQAGAC